MPVFLKAFLLAVIAFVFASESRACRNTRIFNPDELRADLVVRGQLASYTRPRQQTLEEGLDREGVLFGDAILCIRTLETYLGEKRDAWCFDVFQDAAVAAPIKDQLPDDIIVAANTFAPEFDAYVRDNHRWFAPLGIEKHVFNAGCTKHYLIPFSDKAEQDMIERLVRLGFTTSESESGR